MRPDGGEGDLPEWVRPAGTTLPITSECDAKNGWHYCTLAVGHPGDHLTLLDRWTHVAAGSEQLGVAPTPTVSGDAASGDPTSSPDRAIGPDYALSPSIKEPS